MATSSFESCHPILLNDLGFVAYTTGQRPSALIGWDNPSEWEARLRFDTRVMDRAVPLIQKLQGLGGGSNVGQG